MMSDYYTLSDADMAKAQATIRQQHQEIERLTAALQEIAALSTGYDYVDAAIEMASAALEGREMTDDLVKRLRERSQYLWTTDKELLDNTLVKEAADEIEKLRKALDVYERERERFRHAKPEITGEYFLTGGHGERDDNQLPQYVRICPAYGCAFEVVYEKTDRTVTYEGS
jgi:hypothetical protein